MKMRRLMLFSIVWVLTLGLQACKKDASDLYPELIGTWKIPPNPEPCTGLVFELHGNGKAVYHYSSMGETTDHSGKSTMNGDDLYIKGDRIFKIIEIKDTVGKKWNWITYCGYDETAGDSLTFDKILITDWYVLYHFI